MSTFLAPAPRCLAASSRLVKMPVDSTTTSTPCSPQGISAGSRSDVTGRRLPSTIRCVVVVRHLAVEAAVVRVELQQVRHGLGFIRSLTRTTSSLGRGDAEDLTPDASEAVDTDLHELPPREHGPRRRRLMPSRTIRPASRAAGHHSRGSGANVRPVRPRSRRDRRAGGEPPPAFATPPQRDAQRSPSRAAVAQREGVVDGSPSRSSAAPASRRQYRVVLGERLAAAASSPRATARCDRRRRARPACGRPARAAPRRAPGPRAPAPASAEVSSAAR
jgi:hypothetical protein